MSESETCQARIKQTRFGWSATYTLSYTIEGFGEVSFERIGADWAWTQRGIERKAARRLRRRESEEKREGESYVWEGRL